MQPTALRDFEALLNQENPELFKWLTGQLPPPEDMERNAAFRAIREEVQGTMAQHGAVAKSVPGAGAEWVRGWDDWKREGQGSENAPK